MAIQLMVMAVLLPVMTILGFIVGWNTKAKPNEKILVKQKKPEKTPEEQLLERIDRAHL